MRAWYAAVFLLFPFLGAAQQITFNLSAGVGTYAMRDMKNFQLAMKNAFPFEASITDEFPPFLFYEASAYIKPTNRFFTGISVAYGSTGGRVQYRDYSGYLRADQLLRYINVSGPVGFDFEVGDKILLYVDLKPTYTITFADLNFEQEIGGDREGVKHQFQSQTVAVQPGFWLLRRIGQFGLHGQLSYYIPVVKGKLYYNENNNAYLIGNDDKPLYAGWNGVRLSLGVSIVIGE
jgi:hypothetical protein